VSATIASTTQDFVALGFEAGMTLIIDHLNSLDPLFCQIKTVAQHLITLEDAVGDEASVPTHAGVATTAIHAGESMVVSGYAALSC